MDVGVVTPVMDGMNLVAKEMIASNPRAPLILSKGAGTHHQLKENGLSGNYFWLKILKILNILPMFCTILQYCLKKRKKYGAKNLENTSKNIVLINGVKSFWMIE
uniref:Uncharacterized protein n=1 Tax=Meloidogyne enterolobii TaxID=390850 RepID=A0A6V7TTN1_MELEN|nr:unnamed protein product [Meloidogyne enterolobii]